MPILVLDLERSTLYCFPSLSLTRLWTVIIFSFQMIMQFFIDFDSKYAFATFKLNCAIFHDDVEIVVRSKRNLNKNKQTKILIDMHFVV